MTVYFGENWTDLVTSTVLRTFHICYLKTPEVINNTMDWKLVLTVLCLTAVTNTSTINTSTTNTSTTNTYSTTSAPTTNSTKNTTSSNTTSAKTTSTTTTTANTTTANTTSTTTTSTTTTSANTTTNTTTSTTTTSENATSTTPTSANTTSANTTSVNTTSANTTSSTTTTANTTSANSTTNTAPVAAVYSLVFSINETFVSALADKNSPEFAQKSGSICNQLEAYYGAIFTNFIKANILGFSNGSIVTNSSLEFSANGTIPTDATIKSILVNATTNSSLKIIPDSISVTQGLVTNNSTTISTTIIPPTPQNATAIFNLTFSINETFVPTLANTSSSEFAKNATNICYQVEPLYKKAFNNFILMQILNFRSGSTITESKLYMDSSGPDVTVTQVKDVFLNGLKNFNFSVNPGSIMVKQIGNSVPPVIASSVSMIWMSLLTLLLSLALHI